MRQNDVLTKKNELMLQIQINQSTIITHCPRAYTYGIYFFHLPEMRLNALMHPPIETVGKPPYIGPKTYLQLYFSLFTSFLTS